MAAHSCSAPKRQFVLKPEWLNWPEGLKLLHSHFHNTLEMRSTTLLALDSQARTHTSLKGFAKIKH